MTATPRLLAEGRPDVKVYQHVGYLVVNPDFKRDLNPYPDTPMLSLGSAYAPHATFGLIVAVFLVLYALIGDEPWPKRLRLMGLAAGVALVCGGVLRRGCTMAESDTRTLVELERVSAEVEAQAAATGRWPDLAAWRPDPDDYSRLRFRLRAMPPEAGAAWTGYTVAIDDFGRPFVAGSPEMRIESRLFGPDGLFGTRDDDPRLRRFSQPWRHMRLTWPHGREKRDPKVKLPAWPAERTGATRAES